MTTATLRTLGGSVVITVPKQMLRLMNLAVGNQVELTLENGKLIVAPKPKPHYNLSELLAQCNEENMALSDEDQAWLSAQAIGKEVL
ncbi:MAG: AbrB/MazE/SpoVT family DNA-binding domain-containing protein [Methylobacter sp.]